MKNFLFSRRFLIPFFIIWISHLLYLVWDMWGLYKDDFTGKGIPLSLKIKWLWAQSSGNFLLLSFLLALLIGMTYYSHYKANMTGIEYKPFSLANLLALTVIAIAGFVHTAFYEPVNSRKGNELLAAIVYAKSYAEFKMEPVDITADRSMTITQLYRLEHFLDESEQNTDVERFVYFQNARIMGDPATLHKRVKYQIAKKIAVLFSVIFFYVIGVFMGLSLRRIHVIFPLLISYFVVFVVWFYGQDDFRIYYFRDQTGTFFGANGMTVVLGILALIGFFIMRRYRSKQQ